MRDLYMDDVAYADRLVAGAKVAAAMSPIGDKPATERQARDNEWYTPTIYTDAAREVMGGIDLDPASSIAANESVKAAAFYTADDDGLVRPWRGRVWMYPPHTRRLIGRFCAKLIDEYSSGNVPQAFVLVNNATETKWFQQLGAAATALCFIRGRVRFWSPNKKPATPLQGQVVLYLGENVDAFMTQFSAIGWVLESLRP